MTALPVKPAAGRDVAACVAEVEAGLIGASQEVPDGRAALRQRYHGATLPHLGLTLPEQRGLFRSGYSFSRRAPWAQMLIWDAVWHQGRYHETRNQALFFGQSVKERAKLALL